MKHEPEKILKGLGKGSMTWPYRPYWDTIEEVKDECIVHFPSDDGREPQKMTEAEMRQFARREEWYVIEHSVNWGSCDHWTSIPFSKWIDTHYSQFYQLIDNKKRTIGYHRKEISVSLTKDSKFWKAEVWNS